MNSTLISKNVTINGRRTSLRLEQASWEAIFDICESEGLTLHELCTLIEGRRQGSSRTSAVRAFIVTYLRMAAADVSSQRKGTAAALLPELVAHG